jgi:regulator of replication initiation timing|tara:strand:+ start:1091 stop:1276 length:186 start_codon:yes stop_codon:yes gene_type:complete
MEDELKTIRDEVKKLRDTVARLTDQVKDQIEINNFLRKMNGELNKQVEDKEWWKKIKTPRF